MIVIAGEEIAKIGLSLGSAGLGTLRRERGGANRLGVRINDN